MLFGSIILICVLFYLVINTPCNSVMFEDMLILLLLVINDDVDDDDLVIIIFF
jgi:hypothetical protein